MLLRAVAKGLNRRRLKRGAGKCGKACFRRTSARRRNRGVPAASVFDLSLLPHNGAGKVTEVNSTRFEEERKPEADSQHQKETVEQRRKDLGRPVETGCCEREALRSGSKQKKTNDNSEGKDVSENKDNSPGKDRVPLKGTAMGRTQEP